MYQVLVIDDDKLARKGLISLIPWEKYGMWNSFKYRKHLWQERVVRGVVVL